MRITYITRHSPLPLNAGGRFRDNAIWHALKQFADVSLIVLGDRVDWQTRKLLGNDDVVFLPGRTERTTARRLTRYFRAAVTGKDPSAARFLTDRRRDKLQRMLSERAPDLIILGHTILAPAIEAAADMNVPTIIDTHNVESLLSKRIAEQQRNLLARWAGKAHALYLRRFEEYWLPRFSAIWTVSTQDADWYASNFPSIPRFVVPNVVDVERYDWRASGEPSVIAFAGWYRHWPNQDAALRLIALSKRLTARGIDHRVLLIGRDLPQYLRDEAAKSAAVEVVGEVADIAPHLARARIVAAPLRAGSGSNLKIIEGMAAGRAVITTQLGVAGLNAGTELPVWIAESDDDFIEKLIWCITNPETAAQTALAGRQWVEQHMSREALQNIVYNAVQAVARAAKASAITDA
jgi:polysaccharide biosynthesis protein PslH